MSTVSDFLICPQCNKRFLKKSHAKVPPIGLEYFCHWCHDYFGLDELVNVWGYDAGDLVSSLEIHSKIVPSKEDKIISTNWFDGTEIYSFDEPVWSSEIARDESYKVVSNMFLGIAEWADFLDVRDLPSPILMCGSC